MKEKNMDDAVQEIEIEEKEAAKLGFVSRVMNVFFSPVKTFEDIKRENKIILPLLIISVIFSISGYLQLDIIREVQMQTFKQQGMEVTDVAIKSVMISTFAVMALMGVLVPLVKGGVSYGLASISGGKGTFKETFSVILYSMYILALGGLVVAILQKVVGTSITLSPALFFDLKMTDPLFQLLAKFEVFNIWYLVASSIGLKVVHKLSTAKAALIILIPTILTVVPTILQLIGG